MDHIERFGSKHTDAIVTNHHGNAMRFPARGRFRLGDGQRLDPLRRRIRVRPGAEIGISNDKLHARPVGLEGLTSVKWVVLGNGEGGHEERDSFHSGNRASGACRGTGVRVPAMRALGCLQVQRRWQDHLPVDPMCGSGQDAGTPEGPQRAAGQGGAVARQRRAIAGGAGGYAASLEPARAGPGRQYQGRLRCARQTARRRHGRRNATVRASRQENIDQSGTVNRYQADIQRIEGQMAPRGLPSLPGAPLSSGPAGASACPCNDPRFDRLPCLHHHRIRMNLVHIVALFAVLQFALFGIWWGAPAFPLRHQRPGRQRQRALRTRLSRADEHIGATGASSCRHC